MGETQRSGMCRLIFLFESNVLNRGSAFDVNAVIESNVGMTTRGKDKFPETQYLCKGEWFNHYIYVKWGGFAC